MSAPQNVGQSQGKFMMVAAWVTILGLLILIFGHWEEQALNPNQNPVGTTSNGVREVVLQGNRAAHYVVNGKINGRDVTFLLDTGATHVAVPKAIADKAGLIATQPGYAQTANGVTKIDFTRIGALEIGPIQLYDVSASINKNMPDDVVLLGMSALKQLELVQVNNQILLRQTAP